MANNIVPAHLAVKAMRDNGYKNAAYALAELIDNSIQAGASYVELLCKEQSIYAGNRNVRNINQIAVVDNGSGMNAITLRKALQFGNGNYLDEGNHTGIGRFGMGLPSSSMSQCKRVEVWSWQNGFESALYSYLDLDEIQNEEMIEVPEPMTKEVPKIWIQTSKTLAHNGSGTLIVWSNLDKCAWKTGRAVVNNSEFLVGRIYRKFIESKKAIIRMVVFEEDNPTAFSIEQNAVANDPLYLISNASCPSPFDHQPMFELYCKEDIIFKHKGQEYNVKITCSYAKALARERPNAGATDYGKHASKNIGLSIMRADRELELDPAWTISHDPRERWWGVEVDFPPALDDIFGVTNNKQSAVTFAQMAKFDVDELTEGTSYHQLLEEWESYGDPRLPLLELSTNINNKIAAMRKLIKAQTKGNSIIKNKTDVEDFATRVTDERKKEGHVGGSDADEALSPEAQKPLLIKELTDQGVSSEAASETVTRIITNKHKYIFEEADLETPSFFSVRPKAGKILIILNTGHPAYENLVEVLAGDTSTDDTDKLKKRLSKASDGLKLLLTAWARYEDEQINPVQKERVQESRTDWGRVARDFLRDFSKG